MFYIDDPEAVPAGKIQVGKTKLNGDAALFFFLKPVGFYTGEGSDQTGLAMINMAGGAEDDFTHF